MITIGDFADAVGVPVEDVDEKRFSWLLSEAEALLRAYRPSLPDDVSEWPKNAVTVAIRVLARGYDNTVQPGVSQQQASAGPISFSTSYSSDSSAGGLWLSKQDRILLRGRGGGAYAVDTLPADRPYRSAALRHSDEWLWGRG